MISSVVSLGISWRALQYKWQNTISTLQCWWQFYDINVFCCSGSSVNKAFVESSLSGSSSASLARRRMALLTLGGSSLLERSCVVLPGSVVGIVGLLSVGSTSWSITGICCNCGHCTQCYMGRKQLFERTWIFGVGRLHYFRWYS